MFLKYNIWGIIWLLLIFIACATPGEQLPPSPFLDFDKFVHALIFGVLQFLLLRGFALQTKFSSLRKNHFLLATFISADYGVLMEMLQGYLFRNRSFDQFDIMANLIGVAIATVLWMTIFKKRMKPKKNDANINLNQ
jgi:VanZ family protein